ncbi:MAG: hypothetical protein ACRERC_17060 [Candidatus Binatia bacterium]
MDQILQQPGDDVEQRRSRRWSRPFVTMADRGIEQLLGEILRLARVVAAGHEELLTKEQAAAKLTVSVDRLEKWMQDGTLPKGTVWFKPAGLPVRISWTSLCEHYRTASSRTAPPHQDIEDAEIPHWRNRA